MVLNADHLLSYDIPEVRQTYGPANVALYALSVGMGQDPMDQRQLPYVGATEWPKVMPAIAMCWGTPASGWAIRIPASTRRNWCMANKE